MATYDVFCHVDSIQTAMSLSGQAIIHPTVKG
uniref:Uncharacterized protein n=1 Tax=Anguilla anguilla TaxID=7936 RepID=A0A0E9TIL4_ANGAN